jgi:hypothetical protein
MRAINIIPEVTVSGFEEMSPPTSRTAVHASIIITLGRGMPLQKPIFCLQVLD